MCVCVCDGGHVKRVHIFTIRSAQAVFEKNKTVKKRLFLEKNLIKT